MMKQQNKIFLFSFLIIALITLSGCGTAIKGKDGGKIEATLYKSPNCGCCGGHAAVLEQNGVNVNTIPTDDMTAIKKKYNIPPSMESCHTAIIEDYIVEGHVPLEAIQKLLEEQPDIDGIALPRMPAGSPGMPGVKQGPWTIYALKDGVPSEWMVI